MVLRFGSNSRKGVLTLPNLKRAPIVLCILLFLFWILFTGRLEWPSLALGLAISIIVTSLTWRIFLPSIHEAPVHVAPPLHFRLREAAVFFPLYAWDILKATAQVAFLALSPKIRLMPGIVKVETRLKSKTTLVILANQITLTPGTLTVDVDAAHHHLFVHSLNLRTLDECTVCEEVGQLEERLRRLME